MDPIPAGVGFLLGVLTAGAGALFQAQLLEGRREAALRRALVSEVRENIQALRGEKLVVELHRSAWDAARSIDLTTAAFEAVAAAYIEADRQNSANAVVTARFAASESGFLPVTAGTRYPKQPALEAFEKALHELGGAR